MLSVDTRPERQIDSVVKEALVLQEIRQRGGYRTLPIAVTAGVVFRQSVKFLVKLEEELLIGSWPQDRYLTTIAEKKAIGPFTKTLGAMIAAVISVGLEETFWDKWSTNNVINQFNNLKSPSTIAEMQSHRVSQAAADLYAERGLPDFGEDYNTRMIAKTLRARLKPGGYPDFGYFFRDDTFQSLPFLKAIPLSLLTPTALTTSYPTAWERNRVSEVNEVKNRLRKPLVQRVLANGRFISIAAGRFLAASNQPKPT